MTNERQRLKALIERDIMEARNVCRNIPWCLRLTRAEEELGNWFLQAYRKEITIDELEEKFSLLESCLADYDETDMLIDDCIGFMGYDLRHDGPVDWNGLLRYGQILLGQEEIKYYDSHIPGIDLVIYYKKRKK